MCWHADSLDPVQGISIPTSPHAGSCASDCTEFGTEQPLSPGSKANSTKTRRGKRGGRHQKARGGEEGSLDLGRRSVEVDSRPSSLRPSMEMAGPRVRSHGRPCTSSGRKGMQGTALK